MYNKRLMKKNIILILLAFTVSVMAQQSLSVSDAIALGLENNYDLKITRGNERVSEINNTWGNTSLMPSLDFALSGRENFNLNDTENYREQTIVPEVSLNWMIFNGFSAKITKVRLVELEEQSQGNTAILVETTIQDIVLAYNSCLLQKELLQVYENLAQLSEDRYRRSEDSKAIGVSTTYDMLQAKTAWLEDQSNLLQQKVNYDNAVRTLNFLMAADVEAQWDFTTELTPSDAVYSMEDLSKQMQSNNKTLKNQYLYQSLLAKATELERSAYMPTLSMNAGLNNSDYLKDYSAATANLETNSSNAYVGLTLSWSVFNGGTRKRSVEIAKISEEMAQVSTDQMLHSLSNELQQTYSTYGVQQAILSLVEEQEAAAKLNLQLSKEKFENGSINSFNYRDVQLVYMNAVNSRLSATYNLIQSNTDLLRMTGGIIGEYDE